MKKWNPPIILLILLIFSTVTAGCEANNDAGFFEDKTVTIIVPYGAGGGLDITARALAPFLQRYLPGSTVQVQNLTEGGRIDGKNFVYAAQPDGLTLGFMPISGALLAEWEGKPGVQYETAKFSYIGRVKAEAHVLVVSPKTGFTKLTDLVTRKKISMGFTGVGSDDYYVALITAHLLGYQIEARTNYLSVSDAGFACVKGDVDAILFSDSNIHPLITAQTAIPLISFSAERPPTLPDVPTIFESIPAEQQNLMQALVQIYALDQIMVAPPNLSPARLETLRHAFDQAMSDPEFIQSMKQFQRPMDYLNGAETVKLLDSILLYEDEIKPLVLEIAKEAR